MNMYKNKQGFTILELLIVMAIIGTLVAVIMYSVSNSKTKGVDAGRKTQVNEVLKALELYYLDKGVYPAYLSGTHGYLSGIDNSDLFFGGSSSYIKKLPQEAGSHYYYCVSTDQKSILLALDTEQDNGGSNFCNITRSAPPYGCTYSGPGADIDAGDKCSLRF